MKRYLVLRPIRYAGRDVDVGAVIWLAERTAIDAVRQGLVRELPVPVLLTDFGVPIETKQAS